ncbi:MAG: amidase [Longimicrobiales bacterium]
MTDVANQIRRGQVTARTVAEEAIENHLSRGATLNAYVEWDGPGAVRQAERIDEDVRRGIDPGPLAGIPVSVKDLFGVEGFSTRAGTPKPLPPKWQSEGPLVRRLKAAGAVVVGKTHTVEMAYGGVGTNPHWGTPRNPWDSDVHRVPGGSSSGAGVSLHEGSALIAVGSDTGGSIRIPASVTGNVGLKHTTGRWPTEGVVPLSSTLDSVGFLTRTVADTAYTFDVVEARGTSSAGESPQGAQLSGLTIAVVETELWNTASPGIVQAFRTALSELESAGVRVTKVPGELFERATALYLGGGVISAECSAFLERELPGWSEVLDPIIARRLRGARDFPAAAYINTLQERTEMIRGTKALFADADFLATPTVPSTPPTVMELENQEAYTSANRSMLSGTCPVNFLDLCAITLPIGLDQGGMPVGLQLIGNHDNDLGLIGFALAVEKTLGTERLGSCS